MVMENNMLEIVIVGIVLGFVGVGFYLWQRQEREGKREEPITLALDALGHLKALVIHIQQHRGLTTGYLHGNQNLLTQIQQAAMKVNHQWRYIQDLHPDVANEDLFEGVSSHWERLSTRWKQQTVSNNIEQHNRLITNLLYLIENQAEHNLRLVRYARDTGLDVIWKELLETIEAIGQTRAIGMGVVGAGESTTVERIQLKFLLDKVATRLKLLEEAFGKDSVKMDDKSWSKSYIDAAKDKAGSLQNFVETSLLARTRLEVSSETFFELATSAIEPLDALFGMAAQKMKEEYSG